MRGGETIHAAAIHAMTHGALYPNCNDVLSLEPSHELVLDEELGYVSSSWLAECRDGSTLLLLSSAEIDASSFALFAPH